MKIGPYLSIVLLSVSLSFSSGCIKRNAPQFHHRKDRALTVDREAPYHGIDVSHHNGKIDWSKVSKDRNIMFVYIKATEGGTHVDRLYATNFKEAKENGLRVGSYHFFRMTSTPRQQLENMKKHLDKSAQDLIPMIDVETTDGRPVGEVRDSLRHFLSMVKDEYGVTPAIYGTNRSYNEICGNSFNTHPLYIGRYGKRPPIIRGREHYAIWQFSETGRIEGIPEPTDLCRLHPDCDLSTFLIH